MEDSMQEEWESWDEDELEEDLHPIYMTRNEVLFLDDSLTMMIERDSVQDSVTTMRVMVPTAQLPAPVSLIDKIAMAVLRITDPEDDGKGTVVHLSDTDIYMLREITHSYCKVGREQVGYNLKRKFYLALYEENYTRDKKVDALLSTLDEVSQTELN